jgi:hypothetical protein
MRRKTKYLALALALAAALSVVFLTGCATLTPQISYDFGKQRLDVSFIGQK